MVPRAILVLQVLRENKVKLAQLALREKLD